MFLNEVTESPAYEIFNEVLRKTKAGVDVVSLAIGEPSFDTPPAIVEAAVASMKAGATHYISSFGTSEVREAIADKVRRRNGIKADPENAFFITTKLSIFASLVTVAEKGYEALIPDPGYYYSEPIQISGGRPVRYKLGPGFDLDLEEIESRITSKTKALILNTPGNPTGKVLAKEKLAKLYRLCRDRGLTIISDESYEDLVYEKKHHSIGSLEKEPETVVSLFSLSKSFAMTGWRAGYAVASEEKVLLINKFIEGTLSCFPPFIEAASAFALKHGSKFTQDFREELRVRRDMLEAQLAEIPQLEPHHAEGAFYSFPKLKTKASASEVCRSLLEKENLAVIPGGLFGPSGERHVRISFGASRENVAEGMKRLKSGLAAMK